MINVVWHFLPISNMITRIIAYSKLYITLRVSHTSDHNLLSSLALLGMICLFHMSPVYSKGSWLYSWMRLGES